MKIKEKESAINLRKEGHSIRYIASALNVSKSSVSVWVRGVKMSQESMKRLRDNPRSTMAIEKRRASRLRNEESKRNAKIEIARASITEISKRELWLIGVMLYWAEGGKTQRLVRFSNGDPEMIKIMMRFFRIVCGVPEAKFRGYIHIHSHLDTKSAEDYWSGVSGIPKSQYFKTYNKPNKSSKGTRNSLPYGVLDIYVMDVDLFLKIQGWAKGIFAVTDEFSD